MAERKVTWNIGANVTRFTKGFDKAEKRLSRFGDKMSRVGANLTAKITAPIVGLGVISTKVFANFEHEMAKVQAISGASAAEFDSLEQSALELGKTTQFTASQVAGLQVNLSKLGFDPKQINLSTDSILDLALATGEDLAMSATVAASTLRGFSLDASQMDRVVDVMADSFSSTALDLNKFQVAMATVAPVAKVAGADLERVTAILGTLVNRGVDASSAGAALRNIFLDLADKGLTWDEAMSKLNGSLNPLADSMELFGKRGATVATIIANNRREISGLTEDFKDSVGEARSMASIMEDTLTGSFNKLKSALEGVSITLAKSFSAEVKIATDRLAAFFGNLSSENINKIAELAKNLALIPIAFYGIGKSIAALVLIIKGSLAVIAGLKALIIGLSTATVPLGVVLASLALIFVETVLAGQYLVDNFEKMKLGISNTLDSISLSFEMMAGRSLIAIKELFSFLTGDGKVIGALGAFLKIDLSGLSSIGVAIDEAIKGISESVKQGKEELDFNLRLYQNVNWTTIGETATNALSNIKTTIMKGLKGILAGSEIESLWNDFIKMFEVKLDEVEDTVKKSGIGRASLEPVSVSQIDLNDSRVELEKTTKVVDTLKQSAIDLSSALQSSITSSISSFATTIGNVFTGDAGAKGFFNNILTIIADFALQLGQAITAMGVAALSLKSLFANPIAAIAAGSALIIAGTVAKNLVSEGPAQNMATGGIVPPGYPNDTYRANLSSGEMVVPAKPFPLSSMGDRVLPLNLTINLDGKQIYTGIKQVERKFR